VQESAVAIKYAKALFDSALAEERTDRVRGDMSSLLRLRDEEPAFLGFLISPEVLSEQKIEFIRTVFEPRVAPLVASLLRLLVEKARINLLPLICQEFEQLAQEHEGVLRAEVFTATPLASDQEDRLKEELGRITGKNILVESRLEPEVLGGVVVHLGNKIIDHSLRYGFKRLRESLLQVEVN
jgi:F-type H+-transporting ATPase subunit delta